MHMYYYYVITASFLLLLLHTFPNSVRKNRLYLIGKNENKYDG